MLVIETDRVWCIYYRMSKKTAWRYAEYGGRYASKAEAEKIAQQRAKDEGWADYRIDHL